MSKGVAVMSNTTTTPYASFTSALYQTTGQTPNENGMFCCPAHDDSNPSLSVSEGDDGRVLLKCFTGCSAESICNAVGLEIRDLMPTNNFRSNGNNPNGSTLQPKAEAIKATKQSEDQPFDTKAKRAIKPEIVVGWFRNKLGNPDHTWKYQNAEGDFIGGVLRWDKPNGKEIRQVAKNGDGWSAIAMQEPRPLYHLPELTEADCVYICEGEKAVDAARSIGLVATTSAGGSGAAKKTDWRALAGKEIIILPDNDEPGIKYANDVYNMLLQLEPRPTIKNVTLPDLPEKGDIFDWLEERDGKTSDELKQAIEQLANDAKPIEQVTPKSKAQPIEGEPANEIDELEELPSIPFPSECLPYPLAQLIDEGADAIGCDASFIALPLLSALAATIGTTTRLQIKRGWNVPCVLWTVVVGESGTMKSPAFRLVLESIREQERKAREDYFNEMVIFNSLPVERDEIPPEEPVAKRYLIDDTTVEAVLVVMSVNERGLLLGNDELSGWFGSFNQYKGGTGADASHWLKMYNCEPTTVDRKSGNHKSLYVKETSMSICGGIQPGVLDSALAESDHVENGMASRFLFAFPDRKMKGWTEKTVSATTINAYSDLVEQLGLIEADTNDEGKRRYHLLKLSPEAKQRFIGFTKTHHAEQFDKTGGIASAFSKLEEIPARLATIIHCVRWVTQPDTMPEGFDVVDADTMRAAIKLTEWFKYEACRVYAILSNGGGDKNPELTKLMKFICMKKGAVTIRQVQQGCRGWIEDADHAERELNKLVDSGKGRWVEIPAGSGKGSRSTREFHSFKDRPESSEQGS